MASYLELAALETNSDFLARVGYAVGKFAAYIQGEDPTTSGHLARRNWQLKARKQISSRWRLRWPETWCAMRT